MRSLTGTYRVLSTCESGGGIRVSKGFTLIELLVTLAIFALLVSLAAPSYQDLRQRSQVRSALSALADAVALARAEAVTRGVPVDICPLDTTSNSLENGFVVSSREAGAGTCQQPLQIFEQQPANVTIRVSGFSGDAIATFQPDGTLVRAGVFTVCSGGSTSTAQALVVSVAGLSRVAVDSDDDGVVNVSSNQQASCL